MNDRAETSDADDFLNNAACLISAMREVNRVPGSSYNRSNDDWWEQEFLAVENALVERGVLLPRAEWIIKMQEEVNV